MSELGEFILGIVIIGLIIAGVMWSTSVYRIGYVSVMSESIHVIRIHLNELKRLYEKYPTKVHINKYTIMYEQSNHDEMRIIVHFYEAIPCYLWYCGLRKAKLMNQTEVRFAEFFKDYNSISGKKFSRNT